MARFTGFPCPEGLLVLDTRTGEVVLVPHGGGAPVVRRAAVCAPGDDVEDEKPSEALDPLDREIIASFPTPIARAYRRYLEEPDPRLRLKLMVDTFTTTLKLWALVVASEYLRAPSLVDPAMHELLARDLSRPLISSWNRVIHQGLSALGRGGADVLVPELEAAYDALELRCRDRVTLRVRYEDEHGRTKHRDSKLGKITALIRYRNGLAHGFDHDVARAEDDLARYGQVLRDVLEAVRFLARYPLVGAQASPPSVSVRRWVGADPAPDEETLPWLEASALRDGPCFLLDVERERALPLFWFADSASDVLLFEGNTRSTILYVGSSGETVETQRRVAEMRERLEQRGASKEQRASQDGFEAMRAAGEQRTRAAIDRLRRAGKYLPEVTVRRARPAAKLEEFDLGDHRGLVLAGDGGSGKTTLLATRAEELALAGHVVLLYRASALADTDVSARLMRDLGYRRGFFEDFLMESEPLFETRARRLYVLVDAVNEHPRDPAGLVRALDALVAQAREHGWLRVVATIRTPAYERLPPDARFGRAEEASYLTVEEVRGERTVRTPLVTIGGYSDSELREVYERYRDYVRRDENDPDDPGQYVFRPRTAFDALDPYGSTCALMRDPLTMRLLLAAHHRQELPSEISHDAAMRLFLEHVVEQRGAGSGYPERRAFLAALVRELDRRGADGVARDELYAVPQLEAALKNPQKDSPYVQLLDLGVLIEDWEGATCRVAFAHEALFHHLLAEHHAPRVESTSDLVSRCRRGHGFPALRAALALVLERALREGRSALLTEAFRELEDRADDAREVATLAEIARDALVQVGRFARDRLSATLDALAERPSARVAGVLLAVFDRLFAAGEVEPAALVAGACADVAERASAVGELAAALLRQARLAVQRGAASEAFERLGRAHDAALRSGEALLAHRVELLRARLLTERHELDEAEALYDGALEGLLGAEERADAAEALRGLALIAGRRGDRAGQLELLERARELSSAAGDASGLAKTLNNIAKILTEDGRYREAEESFQRALAIHRQLGTRSSIATAELNLGALCYQQLDDPAKAEEHWRRALQMFEAIGHRRGIAAALTNLAGSLFVRGELDEARRLLERAVDEWSASGDRVFTANALHVLTMVLLDQAASAGAIDASSRLHADLSAELGNPLEALHRAVLDARLACRGASEPREIERALAAVEERLAGLESAAALEDGPAYAFRDAARAAIALGANDSASAWAQRALALAGSARLPWRDEMRAYGERAPELAAADPS